MRSFLGIAVAALVGATIGNTVRQLLQRRLRPERAREPEFTIGAPVTNVVIATALGLTLGRRAACCSGMAISLILGSKLDERMPVLGGLHERASRRAANAVEHAPPAADPPQV